MKIGINIARFGTMSNLPRVSLLSQDIFVHHDPVLYFAMVWASVKCPSLDPLSLFRGGLPAMKAEH
jgi:hypothetical protein